MDNILIILGAAGVALYIWATIMIYAFLQKHGENVQSFLLINLFIFKNAERYKAITKRGAGKAGYLYYVWLFSINLALLCFIILFVIR